MAQTDADGYSNTCPPAAVAGVPPLDETKVAFLKKHGIEVSAIEPLGARVSGVDCKGRPPSDEILKALQEEMASRGFLVFTGQGVLSGQEQVDASVWWGGRAMHSTHGVHPNAPNRHIFRLSNDEEVGINGVGPQWHNDGSFVDAVFSHVGYHIVQVPEKGGDTLFAHQGAAFDALPKEKQERWSRLVSVNSNGGVLHPVVHDHLISGRRSVWLHLGMTGAVIEVLPGVKEVKSVKDIRLLEKDEMTALFNDYNDLLNAGLPKNGGNYTISYNYEQGDCIFIDNQAIAHRASPEAHASARIQGLRILHRTTVKGMADFLPGFGLPPQMNIMGRNPCGQGIWQGGGLGFRWDPTIRMQN